MITGLTATSKKNFQLDAGAFYKDFVVGTDTPASAAAKLIGATEGGFVTGITPEARQITVDGGKGPIKGLVAYDSWTATISTTVKEVTKETITLALGAVTQTTSTTYTGYTKITPSGDIATGDYSGNITWLGKIAGAEKPMAIVLKNALSLNGLNYTVADKTEGGIPVTLTAHYDVDALDSAPVELYIPTVSTL